VVVDSVGNVYVADQDNHRIQRLFDADALSPGQTATFAELTVWSDASLGNTLTLDSGKTLEVIGTTTIQPGGVLTLSAATLDTGRLVIGDGGLLNVEGVINGVIECPEGGWINAIGDAALGDPTRHDAVRYEGLLSIRSHTVTLHARGFVNLGVLTELDGGAIAAPNGVVLGPGRAILGSGIVDAKVSASFGSTIEATGNLALGDADAYDGFFSDGSLLTGGHTVTIKDLNEAVLGSLTQLGDGVTGGTLTAGNADPADTQAHFLLEQGKNMIGRGSVIGNYKNHGHVIGDGTGAGERIVFNAPWIVSGKGTFANTLILGTFAPGESPGITTGENQGFGGTVEIELGGKRPGFGNDSHDQINDTGTILLFDLPTLAILPWDDFVPSLGDEFVILSWQAELDGVFGTVAVNSWFTDHEVKFDLHYNNPSGPGNLSIRAIRDYPTLIWNGADPGEWTGDHWEPGPVAPSGDEVMVVDSGTVTVSSDLTARPAASLAIARDAAGGMVSVGPAAALAVTEDVIVGNGGTLSIDGVLVSPVVNVTGGSLTNSRNSCAPIVVNGNVALADEGTLVIDILAAATDTLVVDGTVTLGENAVLDIMIAGGDNAFEQGVYTLIHATGGLIGTFADVTYLGAYVSLNGNGLIYDEAAGTLTLMLDMDLHPGDANLNSATEVLDRIIWNTNNFTEGTTWATGDFNGDGATDVSDRIIWNSHRFTLATPDPLGAPTVPIPEPATLGILLLGWIGVLRRKSR